MKYIMALITIFLMYSNIYCQNTKNKDDLEYYGRVKTIKSFEIRFINGHKSKPKLQSSMLFDKQGNLIKDYYYTDEGKILWGDTNTFDQKGKLTNVVTEHSKYVYLSDRTEYIYNSNGQLMEINGYDLQNKLVNKSTYEYDENNRKSVWVSDSRHPEEHSHPKRTEYKYDGKGLLVEQMKYIDEGNGFIPVYSDVNEEKIEYYYKAHNKPNITIYFFKKKIHHIIEDTYDRFGNVIEETKYNSLGEMTNIEYYKLIYDKYNNWVRQIIYNVDIHNNKPVYHLKDINIQKIDYYK